MRIKFMELIGRVLAAIMLLTCSPIFIILALAIKLESPGPVFYLQTRVGRFGKDFKIFKFRSMRIDTPSQIQLTLGNQDRRITVVGKIIRQFHLDELAQLINVVKGDMTLVGPRPEVPEFMQYYPMMWDAVLQVKPGITGLAAVKCAQYEYKTLAIASNPYEVYITHILPKKLRYECFYVKKRSITLDILILTGTIRRFLRF